MTDDFEDQMIAKTEGYLAAKKTEQALESADELAEVDPKDAIVWYLKGKAHYLSGQYDEALAALAKAASIQSEQTDIWLAMGYALIALRRYSEALPSLEYVKGIKPDSAEATAALCVLHTILGNPAQAKTYLEQGLQIDRTVTSEMLHHFFEQFFSASPALNPATKAELQKLMEKL